MSAVGGQIETRAVAVLLSSTALLGSSPLSRALMLTLIEATAVMMLLGVFGS